MCLPSELISLHINMESIRCPVFPCFVLTLACLWLGEPLPRPVSFLLSPCAFFLWVISHVLMNITIKMFIQVFYFIFMVNGGFSCNFLCFKFISAYNKWVNLTLINSPNLSFCLSSNKIHTILIWFINLICIFHVIVY